MKLRELLDQLGVGNVGLDEEDYEVRIECSSSGVYEPHEVRFEHNDKVVVIEA